MQTARDIETYPHDLSTDVDASMKKFKQAFSKKSNKDNDRFKIPPPPPPNKTTPAPAKQSLPQSQPYHHIPLGSGGIISRKPSSNLTYVGTTGTLDTVGVFYGVGRLKDGAAGASLRNEAAQFWIAESYAAEKNLPAADAAYAAVVSNFASSPKAATAMYKRGMLALQQGQKAQARQLLEQVVSRFPKSDEAVLAEEQLKSLR